MPAFQKGQSGNPKGRTPGTKDKRTELRELLKPHAEKLVKKAVAPALKGDTTAPRICIDRIIPPVRESAVRVSLPDLNDADGCRKAQATVIESVAAGSLLPGEGGHLSAMIDFHRKGIEGAEIMERLRAIQERLGMKGERQ